MDNFFNWISKPIPKEDIELWLNANNIILEKSELFSDFCTSLYELMLSTYLGEFNSNSETKVTMNNEDNLNHFNWCWKKTIENFEKENLNVDLSGEHYDYFLTFFNDVFYYQENDLVRKQIGQFMKDLFDKEKTFTKSDLDLYTNMYKLLDRYIKK